MSKRCCAKTCFNSQTTNTKVNYFGFPKNVDSILKWSVAAGREDLLVKPVNNIIKYWLCSEHFTDDCFVDPPFNTKLKKIGRPHISPIPTIFKLNINENLQNKIMKTKQAIAESFGNTNIFYNNDNNNLNLSENNIIIDEQNNIQINVANNNGNNAIVPETSNEVYNNFEISHNNNIKNANVNVVNNYINNKSIEFNDMNEFYVTETIYGATDTTTTPPINNILIDNDKLIEICENSINNTVIDSDTTNCDTNINIDANIKMESNINNDSTINNDSNINSDSNINIDSNFNILSNINNIDSNIENNFINDATDIFDPSNNTHLIDNNVFETSTCRLCANVYQNQNELIHLFADHSVNLLNNINSVLLESIQENDGMPQYCCTSCQANLNKCIDTINTFRSIQNLYKII